MILKPDFEPDKMNTALHKLYFPGCKSAHAKQNKPMPESGNIGCAVSALAVTNG
jgi:hypothetical protein